MYMNVFLYCQLREHKQNTTFVKDTKGFYHIMSFVIYVLLIPFKHLCTKRITYFPVSKFNFFYFVQKAKYVFEKLRFFTHCLKTFTSTTHFPTNAN